MKSICFTGHRPQKLGGFDWYTYKNQVIMKEISDTTSNLIQSIWNKNENEFITFYFGGALGVDQMAFEIVNNFRRGLPDVQKMQQINRILAMPFEKQDNNWFKQDDKKRLRRQRELSDEVILVDTLEDYKIKGYIEGEYYPAKMQKRNEYIVDNADIVIAVWDGSSGGTGNCVKYARKLGKEIIVINPKEV